MATRTKIANANGISNYTGTADQNDKLVDLMKAGKLINPGLSHVVNEPAKVTLNMTTAAMNVGQIAQLVASFPEGTVSWKSSNTKVATVTVVDADTVTIKAVKAGKATITCTLSNGSVAKCVITVKNLYFAKCKANENSIVDALEDQGFSSSFESRTKIAEANGISNYKGTADQNDKLVDLMKAGKLINPCLDFYGSSDETTSDGTTSDSTSSSGKYYPKCADSYESIAAALRSIGVDGSWTFRTKIAAANKINEYTGTAEQNDKMLDLLKAGKLIKPEISLAEGEALVCFNANGGTGTMADVILTSGSAIPKNTFTWREKPSRVGQPRPVAMWCTLTVKQLNSLKVLHSMPCGRRTNIPLSIMPTEARVPWLTPPLPTERIPPCGPPALLERAIP